MLAYRRDGTCRRSLVMPSALALTMSALKESLVQGVAVVIELVIKVIRMRAVIFT